VILKSEPQPQRTSENYVKKKKTLLINYFLKKNKVWASLRLRQHVSGEKKL